MSVINGNILLIVADEANRIKYEQYLTGAANFTLITELNKAYQQCLQYYYDLVLVDLKLSLGQGRLYLDKINSLSHPPPILKIRPRQETVDVLLMEQRGVEDLNVFLKKFSDKLKEEESLSANLRKYKRYESIMRVTINQNLFTDLLRANTLNISQGGLFITTPFPFECNKELEVKIYDVAHDPIKTTVGIVWMRPWDVPHHLPGIGCRFISFDREGDRYVIMEYLNNVLENPKGKA